jgi:dGTPase
MNHNQEPIQELYELLRDQVLVAFNHNSSDGKTSEWRSTFQREYDRIIFSDYFHSMTTKTQVVPSPNNDHTHTRLTHSLEVASLGFSFGKKLLEKFEKEKLHGLKPLDPLDKDLFNLFNDLPLCIATACLVHDIGNPPFGHAGEEAIQEAIKHFFHLHNDQYCYKTNTPLNISKALFKDLTYFDGNAYGFRVLTRLAGAYSLDPSQDPTGLNFNPLTLCVYTKYPWKAGKYPGNSEKKKFGYLNTELQIYEDNIINSLQWKKSRRHPLTYLVEAADDICYFIMDCEDGIKNGHLSFRQMACALKLNKHIEAQPERKKLAKSFKTLKGFDPNKPILISELKAMENIRASIIHHYVKRAFEAYLKNLKVILDGLDGEIKIDLFNEIFKTPEAKKAIKKFQNEKLYNSLYIHTRKMTMEISGHRIIRELLELCFDALASLKKADYDLGKTDTHSQHILRFMGYALTSYKDVSDDEMVMRAIDFVVQHSDRDLIQIHKQFTDFEFKS